MTTEHELKEKLLRWAGFKKIAHATAWGSVAYCYPDGNLYSFDGFPPFPHSLDACFKWLVPNITHMELGVEFWCYGRHGWAVFLDLPDGGEILVEAETPPLALCRAIEQLIDKEGK